MPVLGKVRNMLSLLDGNRVRFSSVVKLQAVVSNASDMTLWWTVLFSAPMFFFFKTLYHLMGNILFIAFCPESGKPAEQPPHTKLITT